MRRPSFLFVLIALGALVLPTTALGASAAHGDSESVVVASGDVTVARGETVDDVFVVHGDVVLAGHAEGDVTVISGNVRVAGKIDGNLTTISGRARLLPGSYVAGDVRYFNKHPWVFNAGRVGGSIEEVNAGDGLGFLPFLGILSWLAFGISAAILGALLLLIAPRAADAIFASSHDRIGPLIGIGIAITICLFLAVLLAAVTLVGIPLAIAILLALLPLWAIAYVCSAWALGRRIVKPPRNRTLSFLAGLAILRAVALVPILGWLVGLAAVVFGLGLIGAAIGAAREPRGAEPSSAQSPGS
ncbi:MAG: hypothetical protein ACTHKT_00020 [Solirubrobacterales bacterium]